MKYVLLLFVCGYGMFASVACRGIWDIIEESNKNLLDKTKQLGRTTFTSIDTPNITQGDILVEPDEPKPLLMSLGRAANADRRKPYDSWQDKIWNTRNIPYEIAGSLYSNKAVIKKSLQMIQARLGGCLSFRGKRASDKWWLSFFVGGGCYSGIGKKYWKEYSATKISLGMGCTVPAIIMHEVLHALGFPHEQSRRDRNSHVNIYFERIIHTMKDNFRMNEVGDTNTMGTPYDYKSIMHYSTTTFAIDPRKGNTIERKFDPNFEIANSKLSEMDVIELKRLYKCKNRQGGWSDWYDWSVCRCNWLGECQKSKVRICIGAGLCPGVNSYGTGYVVKTCSKAEAKRAKSRADGFWGHWSPFSRCDSSCGWGYQKRTRKCDNPRPAGIGKSCVGIDRQRVVCRRPKCGASSFDENFEKRTSNWAMKGFSRRQYTALADSGPKRDHTFEGTNIRGYFAAAWGEGNGEIKTVTLTSRTFVARRTRCLTFHYMMDGQNINKMQVYIKSLDGQRSYLNIMTRKGHQGNWWIRAALNIPTRPYRYQFVIKYTFATWRLSILGIDDIFVDNNACPVGLVGCKDNKRDCRERGINGECNASGNRGRQMVAECCATCQDDRYRDRKYGSKKKTKKVKPKPTVPKKKKKPTGCTDKPKMQCPLRAGQGQCTKYAAWMKDNCCASCKNKGKKTKVTQSECTDKPKLQCPLRAESGQCTKYAAWMKKNCCESCKNKGKKTKVTKSVHPCDRKKNPVCSQKCRKDEEEYTCYCNAGFTLGSDGKSCKKKKVRRCSEKEKGKGCRDKPGLKCSARAIKYRQCTDYSPRQSKWMRENCCASCKKVSGCSEKEKEKGCRDKPGLKCSARANKYDQCTGYSPKHSKWMRENCCASCKEVG